jgi:hypothetical protein
MAERNILSTLGLGGLVVAAACATGVAATSNSEAIISNAFSAALNAYPAPPSTVAKSVPVAASEEAWLTAMRPEGGLPVMKTVSVGDRMALSFGGKNIQLEVADVSAFAPKVTEIDTRSTQPRFVLVTARDTANPDTQPVRFVIEVEQAPVGTVAIPAGRAL